MGGASVRSAVKPMGGQSHFAFSAMVYMAGAATLDGPFLWRIEAQGLPGVHQSMTVHRLKVITSKTKRSEWYPVAYLGKPEPFKVFKKEPNKLFATFQVPGKLKIYPKTDGDISILVDVSITTKKSTTRRLVKFSMKTKTSKDVEFINLPAEIVKGSSKDPREWQW